MFIDFLKQELGESRDAGGETRFNCPFCGETDQKMYVQNSKGLWICFKCSETGNPVSFVMKHYGIGFVEAKDILALHGYDVDTGEGEYDTSQYGEELTPEERLYLFVVREGEPLEKDVKEEYTMPKPPTNTKSLSNNLNNPEAFPFFAYLHKRGVTLEQIHTHNISYVTYGTVELRDGREMDLVNHLVFFTFNNNKEPIYWNTRSIDPNPFIKSFNAPSDPEEYSKSNTIFNLNNALNTDKIVINEGVFDAMTVGESGVATFGKKITHKQIELIKEAVKGRATPIYLFLDSDAVDETVQAVNKLNEQVNSSVYIVINNTDKDANDLGKEACEDLIQKAIKGDSGGVLHYITNNM